MDLLGSAQLQRKSEVGSIRVRPTELNGSRAPAGIHRRVCSHERLVHYTKGCTEVSTECQMVGWPKKFSQDTR